MFLFPCLHCFVLISSVYQLHIVYAATSCQSRCGQSVSSSHECQCNTACKTYNDCCNDYDAVCLGATCSGRCGYGHDSTKPCQCNTPCKTYSDCCPDYEEQCNGGVSTETCDMSCLAEKMWNDDVNRIPSHDVRYNPQTQTSSSGSTDDAWNTLFTYVNEQHFTKPTYQKFISLLDNYNRNIGEAETLTSSEWVEIEDFLDTIIPTQVMQHAYAYLLRLGHVTGAADFKDILKELWFNLYPRSSKTGSPIDSSGFEHAMVGELKGTVSGFHSWIQFYEEEQNGRINYLGYVSRANPDIIGAKFTWHGQLKSKGSFFIGTSPEFDLALYSVCALTNTNGICSFTMGGNSIRIQTWDINHKSGIQIGSAYPAI